MPDLIVIAGPNGAGKSTNAIKILQRISTEKLESFDFDKRKWDYYKQDFDHELREQMAHTRASQDFSNAAAAALKNKKSFCYETNFHDDNAMEWPTDFKKEGFQTILVFLALQDVEKSIERVAIRVMDKGHNVPVHQIKERYKGSIGNVLKHYKEFDRVLIIDSNKESFEILAEINKGKVMAINTAADKQVKEIFKPLFKDIDKGKDKGLDQGLSM
jgi:predicted ABC-type ATPase